jgi:hypothetical protein
LSLQGVGDGADLDFTGVLEAALPDGSLQLVLQKQLVPTGEVAT